MILRGRFDGTVVRLGPVAIAPLAAWVTAIPFEQWPQQDRVGGELRPAMVNSREWQGFGAATDAIVSQVLSTMTDGGAEQQRLLSAVMPGASILPHVDKVSPRWWGRVHLPLTSDPLSRFIVDGHAHHLEPGWAYLVNITAEHSVEHAGAVPRVHFMVDIGGH